VRSGNNIHDAGNNIRCKAQYGRVTAQATELILTEMKLTSSDTFFDVGSGLGNLVSQAAFCYGCQATGIEIMKDRHDVAMVLLAEMKSKASSHDESVNFGDAILASGDFRETKWSDKIEDCTAIFVNNFNEIFGARAETCQKMPTLNSEIQVLFAKSKVGTRMVTLDPMCFIKSLTEARYDNPEISTDASFFDYKSFELPSPAVSWSNKPVTAHMYTRIEQSQAHAVFLCPNKKCYGADNITAAVDDSGKLVEMCCYCDVKLRAGSRKYIGKSLGRTKGATSTSYMEIDGLMRMS
jgi:hypothetical protein